MESPFSKPYFLYETINDEIESGEAPLAIGRSPSHAEFLKLAQLVTPVFGKSVLKFPEHGNIIKDILKNTGQYFEEEEDVRPSTPTLEAKPIIATKNKAIKILFLFGGSGSGKTTAFKNFIKNLKYEDDADFEGLFESHEISFRTDTKQIYDKKVNHLIGSPLNNNNVTSLSALFHYLENSNTYKNVSNEEMSSITIYKNLNKTINKHFEFINKLDAKEKLKDKLTDFRSTATKVTDNNKTSSRSHVIHYLLIRKKEGNKDEGEEEDETSDTITIDIMNINTGSKFYKEYYLYIIVDTMGFEDLMSGLGTKEESSLFLYMNNISKIDNLTYYSDKSSESIKNLKEGEEYVKNLAREAAVLIELISTFINTPLIATNLLREYERKNKFNELIRPTFVGINNIEEEVCFLPLVFFDQDLIKADFIFKYYKNIVILQNIPSFYETIQNAVKEFDSSI